MIIMEDYEAIRRAYYLSLYSAENIAAHTEGTFAVALALLLLEARAWADDLLV
jgi:hypothetical protein